MRKSLLLVLSALLASACVDNDYDLSKIDTDQVAIGDETSEFRAPLAIVRVSQNQIGGSASSASIDEMFAEADTWLPSTLYAPGSTTTRVDYVAIDRLDENAYVRQLVAALVAEMTTSSTKLEAVASLISTEKYIGPFLPLLPGVTAADFKRAFIEAFTTDATLRQNLSSQVESVAAEYLSTLGDIEPLDYDLGSIDLDSSVVDMLADNLDPEGTANARNTLTLYGEIDNSLPLALTLAPQFINTGVQFSVDVDKSAGNPINEVRIYASDLRTIVAGTRIRIPVELTRYYPGIGFNNSTSAVVIHLSLLKKGGLSLNI